MRDCEEDARDATVETAEQAGACGAGGVHHRGDVGHLLLETREGGLPIRQARTALVEADDASERSQSSQESRVRGLFPPKVEMRQGGRDEDEIARTLTVHLVRDVRPGTPRVAGLGNLVH